MIYLRIKINLQIFLFIIIFVFTHQIKIYGCIMFFALIHELGHMIAGILLNLKPKSLEFMPFGISIVFETYGYKKLLELKKIFLALAGPITNFIIILLVYFLNINIEIKQIIIYSNILIGIFNLIPIYPLDGGRVLKGIIKLKYPEMKSNYIVNKISNAIVIILTAMSSIGILYFKNIAILFIIIYLWFIVIKENKKYSMKKKVYDTIQKREKCIDI